MAVDSPSTITASRSSISPKDAYFPRFAIDYFRQLRNQYELLLEVGGSEAPATIVDLFARIDRDGTSTTWADVFTLEAAYLYALPDERLVSEVLFFRSRYQNVADSVEFAAYANGSTLDPAKATPAEWRAELMTVAERLRYLYTFVPPKEATRNKLSRDAALLTLLLVAGAVAAVAIEIANKATGQTTILLVAFAGVLGGFLSVQQRLQQQTDIDPLFKELQLSAGWFGVVFIAPISGGVFATVLFWIFLAHLIEGPLVPTFGPILRGTGDGGAGSLSLQAFVNGTAPHDVADYGKLLVWSFVAGFAERFVPDVLTRLTQQVASSTSTIVLSPARSTARTTDSDGRAESQPTT